MIQQESLGLYRLTEYEAMVKIREGRIQHLREMREKYEAKARKIRDKYQETGSGALKPAEDAEDIVDVIDMALRQVNDDGRDYLRKMENINGMIARLSKETYTKEEVIALLKQTTDF